MAKAKSDSIRGIPDIRRDIDSVDDQILRLLEQRAKLAQEIGEVKRASQSASRAPGARVPTFYDPVREKQVLKRLQGSASGPFPRSSVPFVFREVMSACRSLEASLRVAFLGPQGTYSQIAAHQVFGHSVQFVDSPTIEAVFEALHRGDAEYGVVPIENSYEGGILQTLDCLMAAEVRIQSEHYLRINHCLVSKKKTMSGITKVISHPQGIAQCRNWLKENLPKAARITVKSTAEAAKLAAKDPSAAAISSLLAAENFKLNVLREGVQDQPGNATRFVVLVRADNDAARTVATGNDRSTLIIEPMETTGTSIAAVLQVFTESRIELVRTESRATGEEPWRMAYFIDLKGHESDPAVQKALAQATPLTKRLRVLGSYPDQR